MKDIYLTYDAVQLAADEDFIRWVKVGTASDETAWQAWLDLHPEQRPSVEEGRRLVKSLTFNPKQPQIDKDQLWNRIQTSSRETAVIKPIAGGRRALWRIAGVAAAIALLLFVVFGIDRPQRVETAMTEHSEQVLPDQSKVQLNADSRMSYDNTGRRVELAGEAFFAVEKGTDFVVETPLGQIKVLGTRFNVFSRGDRFRVHCTQGRVQVTTPTDQEGVILTPGMACVLMSSGQLETENLSGLDIQVGWLKDIYRFKNQPMREVFEELERQFDLKVVADEDILSQLHTGSFVGGDLEKALQEICWPQKLKFSIAGKQVRITEDDTE